jgi:hypothetical protein
MPLRIYESLHLAFSPAHGLSGRAFVWSVAVVECSSGNDPEAFGYPRHIGNLKLTGAIPA